MNGRISSRVGLLYEQGYFTQTVDNDGAQHAEYVERDPRDLPVEPERNAGGEWVKIMVRIGARDVVARVWKAQVGRVAVYLLDTNCPRTRRPTVTSPTASTAGMSPRACARR